MKQIIGNRPNALNPNYIDGAKEEYRRRLCGGGAEVAEAGGAKAAEAGGAKLGMEDRPLLGERILRMLEGQQSNATYEGILESLTRVLDEYWKQAETEKEGSDFAQDYVVSCNDSFNLLTDASEPEWANDDRIRQRLVADVFGPLIYSALQKNIDKEDLAEIGMGRKLRDAQAEVLEEVNRRRAQFREEFRDLDLKKMFCDVVEEGNPQMTNYKKLRGLGLGKEQRVRGVPQVEVTNFWFIVNDAAAPFAGDRGLWKVQGDINEGLYKEIEKLVSKKQAENESEQEQAATKIQNMRRAQVAKQNVGDLREQRDADRERLDAEFRELKGQKVELDSQVGALDREISAAKLETQKNSYPRKSEDIQAQVRRMQVKLDLLGQLLELDGSIIENRDARSEYGKVEKTDSKDQFLVDQGSVAAKLDLAIKELAAEQKADAAAKEVEAENTGRIATMTAEIQEGLQIITTYYDAVNSDFEAAEAAKAAAGTPLKTIPTTESQMQRELADKYTAQIAGQGKLIGEIALIEGKVTELDTLVTESEYFLEKESLRGNQGFVSTSKTALSEQKAEVSRIQEKTQEQREEALAEARAEAAKEQLQGEHARKKALATLKKWEERGKVFGRDKVREGFNVWRDAAAQSTAARQAAMKAAGQAAAQAKLVAARAELEVVKAEAARQQREAQKAFQDASGQQKEILKAQQQAAVAAEAAAASAEQKAAAEHEQALAEQKEAASEAAAAHDEALVRARAEAAAELKAAQEAAAAELKAAQEAAEQAASEAAAALAAQQEAARQQADEAEAAREAAAAAAGQQAAAALATVREEAAERAARDKAAADLEIEKQQVQINLHRLNEAFSVSKKQLDEMHTALTNPQFYDLSRSCPPLIETKVNELKQCIGIGRESLMWYELDAGIQLNELLQEQKAELEEYSILKEIFPDEIEAPCAEGDEEKDIGFYKQQNEKLAEFTQKVCQEHQTEYAGNFNTFLRTNSAAATAGEAEDKVDALRRYLKESCQGLTRS
jgi:hypothetical protein